MTNEKINHVCNEMLARLLCQENISVQHKRVTTAGFDVKSRTLILPIYKDITENVYDLFLGHECSHALHTPAKQWEAAIKKQKQEVQSSYKMIVNILEDVRIEKLIKKIFPGLIRSFFKGYNELLDRDFFGLKDRDVDKLHTLDRINLYFKVGSTGRVNLKFNDLEKKLIEEIDQLNTFEEVVVLADRLIEDAENNKQYDTDKQNPEDGSGQGDEKSEQKKASDKGDNESSSSKSNQKGDQDSDNESESDQSGEDSDGKNESKSSNKSGDNKGKESKGEYDLGSTLDKENENLQKMIDLDQYTGKENVYIDVPQEKEIDLSKIIIDYKKLHEDIYNHYNTQDSKYGTNSQLQLAKVDFDKFKLENSPIVLYLVKEFEMKKSAEAHYRTLTAKTGLIDTNKLHSYRYNDDIFLKKDVISDGKNHGLVMFIDCSDSMRECIADTYEQLINLVLFCRKVSIPFEVYGFTDRKRYASDDTSDAVKAKSDTVKITDFLLKNYFSSRMNATEFNSACINIQCIINYYRSIERYSSKYSYHLTIPSSEVLHSTPLNSTIIASTGIINQFRSRYNIEKLNVIFLTDGESNNIQYWNSRVSATNINRYSSRLVLKDSSTKKEYSVQTSKSYAETIQLYNYLRDKTNANILGFYLYSSRKKNYLKDYIATCLDVPYTSDPKVEECYKKYSKDKTLIFDNANGYDQLYVISTKALEIEDEEFVIEKGQTRSTIAKNLVSNLKGKIRNRILLSSFIEQIA